MRLTRNPLRMNTEELEALRLDAETAIINHPDHKIRNEARSVKNWINRILEEDVKVGWTSVD